MACLCLCLALWPPCVLQQYWVDIRLHKPGLDCHINLYQKKTSNQYSLQRTSFEYRININKSIFKQHHIGWVCGMVSKGQDMPQDILGQRDGTGCPVVPLTQDKNNSFSRCPFVPGQGQEYKARDKLLSPDVPGQNHFPKINKNRKRTF